jgi:hypothetical protein
MTALKSGSRFGRLALGAGIAVSCASALGHDLHSSTGHLFGTGEFGNIELVSKTQVTQTPRTVADVAVSPDGRWAFIAHWGKPDCASPAERGGVTSPDAGAWVVDISNLSAPKVTGFIPSHQDTRPGEGMQVVRLQTKFFSGNVLVMNNEQCGKNGKGGISLWDVRNPLKPTKLSTHFGDRGLAIKDAHDTHSAFAWQAGDKAYAVMVDNFEGADVDILDITNPARPRLIRELNLSAGYPQINQTALGLVQNFLHDVVVKQINGHWIMLLSNWDAGFVQLNVDDPANPVLIGDTDYTNPDPELLESLGVALPPAGNGHQAEFTADNRFFIGTDEDFAPYGATSFQITSGPYAGAYASVPVPGAAPITMLADGKLNGPVVYGGYGCAASAAIPRPEAVPGYLATLLPGDEKIVVMQRGPAGDPSAPEGACFPGEKAHQAVLAGWDAVVFATHHAGASAAVPFCGSGGFVDAVVGVCTTHEAMHKLFNQAVSLTYPDGPAIGTVGERVEATAAFDGWGYVHLYSNTAFNGKFAELDTYAIPEAHDPAFAVGFGNLTVHEVATDPLDWNRAYLSYYAGGLRALKIDCADPNDPTTCELVETGGYLGAAGNDFWGVEVFVRDGQTYILGSDRDFGLFIFRRND